MEASPHRLTHTSVPCLLYSKCTARPYVPISQHLYTLVGSALAITHTVRASTGSELSTISTQIHWLLGCVLMNRLPDPGSSMVRTAFQAWSGCPSGSVPTDMMEASLRWGVLQTGPKSGSIQLAPRPGGGTAPTSAIPANSPFSRSTMAILF